MRSGCRASSGPGYAALGIGGGAIAVGAAAYGASQLWAGPQAMSGGAAVTFSPAAPAAGGAAEELASLGPEDAGEAVPGVGNLIAAVDAVRFNASVDARQPTKKMGLKTAGNANVGTNGGVPGRGAGAEKAEKAEAPVREGTMEAPQAAASQARPPAIGVRGAFPKAIQHRSATSRTPVRGAYTDAQIDFNAQVRQVHRTKSATEVDFTLVRSPRLIYTEYAVAPTTPYVGDPSITLADHELMHANMIRSFYSTTNLVDIATKAGVQTSFVLKAGATNQEILAQLGKTQAAMTRYFRDLNSYQQASKLHPGTEGSVPTYGAP